MKQITYEIRGVVTEAMIPAITASCESLQGVQRVCIGASADGSTASLTLLWAGTLDGEDISRMERLLAGIMNTKGLELVRPALSLEDAEMEPPPPPIENPPDPPQTDGPPPNRYVTSPPPKEGKQISLTAAVSTVITAVILAVLVTFSVTRTYMKIDVPDSVQTGQEGAAVDSFAELDMIDRLFRSVSVLKDRDEDAILAAVLKGYVEATGDVHAAYYTEEEYNALLESQSGEMCGIGIGIMAEMLVSDGLEYEVITVGSVYPDSPAERAGVRPGDYIVFVGSGDDRVSVPSVGYDEASNRLRGEAGTDCVFTVYRRGQGPDNSEDYEVIDITATRQNIATRSVMGRVHEEDASVGIVRILDFENNTLPQFIETMEKLKAEGCQYFIFDLRSNPGGRLTSVEDMLVLFLQEGDVMYSTKDAAGVEAVVKVTVNQKGMVACGTGQLTKDDVGRYRDLKFAVLVNQRSASAAELFTANMRDYELAKVVGVQTYGKGSIQNTITLSRYGYDGAIKLTTRYYFPPCGEGYDGIGITPHVVVPLSEEALSYNINLLPDRLDNQLEAAIKTMK